MKHTRQEVLDKIQDYQIMLDNTLREYLLERGWVYDGNTWEKKGTYVKSSGTAFVVEGEVFGDGCE